MFLRSHLNGMAGCHISQCAVGKPTSRHRKPGNNHQCLPSLISTASPSSSTPSESNFESDGSNN
ncbi:unnamed protein product [Nesidiocoris tenuis]|uniref:Uncharacterized protein n=1 Tax=Nesidiocoris tenuis TaxID=355587 RepID=A0A6H5GHD5_9HEMI|nr:unnamed protein product [Nesidiocoris tenuis]